MNGYQLIFFTLQERSVAGKPVADWLLDLARELGLRGATLIPAGEGLGHDHRLHAAGFFELAGQPQLVLMAVSADEAERVLARVAEAGLALFYLKTPAEFGVTAAGAG